MASGFAIAALVGLALPASGTLADAPPDGFEVAFQFSGAQNDNDGTGDEIATALHCTNRGADELQVMLEFFGSDGGTPFESPIFAIPRGHTRGFTTQAVPAVFGTDLLFGFFSSASGRVLASGPGLICTAQLVDPLKAQPRFLAKLALYDGHGELITRLPEPSRWALQLAGVLALGWGHRRRRRPLRGRATPGP